MTFFLDVIFLAAAVLTPHLLSIPLPEQPPLVVVSCANQGSPPCCGSRLRFDATVGNVDPHDKLTYVWSLTKGRILSGQGTSSIEIDASDAREQPIMVTLEVGFTYEVRIRGRKQKRRGVVRASEQTCTFPRPPTNTGSEPLARFVWRGSDRVMLQNHAIDEDHDVVYMQTESGVSLANSFTE